MDSAERITPQSGNVIVMVGTVKGAFIFRGRSQPAGIQHRRTVLQGPGDFFGGVSSGPAIAAHPDGQQE